MNPSSDADKQKDRDAPSTQQDAETDALVLNTLYDTTASGKIIIKRRRRHSEKKRSRFQDLDVSGLPRSVAEWSVWIALILAPFLMGAPLRVAAASFPLYVLLLVGVTAFVADRFLHRLPAQIPPIAFGFLGIALYMMLQGLSLPSGIVAWLNPAWNDTAHAVLDGLGLYGQGQGLSLAVDGVAARYGAAQVAMVAGLFLVASHYLVHKKQKTGILWICALSGFATLLVATVHMTVSATKIYFHWPILPVPTWHFFGPFTDNHTFGMFLGLSLLMQGVLLFLEQRTDLRLLIGFLALCTAGGLLLTFSATAWLSFLAGLLVLLSMVLAKRFTADFPSRLLELGGLLAAIVLVLVGVPLLHHALGSLAPSSPAVDGQHGAVAWELIKRHPWTGLGAGGYAQAVTWISNVSLSGERGYPHNIVMQILADLGLPVGLCLIAAFLVGFFQALLKPQKRSIEMVALAGMVLLLLGDQYNAGLNTQALALPFITLCAISFGRTSERAEREQSAWGRWFRPIRLAPIPTAILAALLFLGSLVGASGWVTARLDSDRQRMAVLARSRDVSMEEFDVNSAALFRRHPGDWYLHILAGDGFPLGSPSFLPKRVLHLNKAALLAPNMTLPDLLLGRSFAAVNRKAEALSHYRKVVAKTPPSGSLNHLYKGMAAFRFSLEDMVGLAPTTPTRRVELAHYLVLHQGRRGAECALRLCGDHEPVDDAYTQERLFIQALALLELSRYREAALVADRMIGRFVHDYRGYWLAARIADREGRCEVALDYYHHALQRKAPELRVWPSMAYCELRLDNPLRARSWAKKLQTLSWKHPHLKTDCRLLFADIAEQEKKLMEARGECREVLRQEPGNVKALVRLARYAAMEGDWAEAERLFDRAKPRIHNPTLVRALKTWLEAGRPQTP